MQIEGKTVVVTGAGSGLGAATARMVIEAGGSALLVDMNDAAVRSVAESLGGAVQYVQGDVANEADGLAAVQAGLQAFGRIDALVNCAGIAPAERILGRTEPHALDSFSRVISVNLIGTFNMMRLVARVISEQSPDEDGERGVIVNTASIAAQDGQIGQVAYAASKGGVASLTLPAARELARHGIRVVTIAPGLFLTPLVADLPQDVKTSLGSSVPFPPRLGDPAEYAAMVRHILENKMLNGEVIRLDGALRMAPR
ncbi:MAG: SDR family NAD(P)-dependent oxidoreductase [Phyllobacteriaceae bacterium]|nr:SDR family NAD(P)-dependent oxidoreductase [Phyllobacteriaceae bacterium]